MRKVGLRRHALEIAAIRGVSAVGFAAVVALLARLSTSDHFARILAGLGIMQFLSVALDMGISTAISRKLADDQYDRDVVGRMVRAAMMATLLLALIGSSLVSFLMGSLAVGLACAIVGAGDKLVDLFVLCDISRNGARQAAVLTAVRRSVALCLLGLLAIASPGGEASVWAVGFCLALGSGIAGLIAGLLLARAHPSESVVGLGEVIAESFPYWLNSLGYHARSLDVYLVLLLVPGSAASYAAVSRLTSPLLLVASSFSQALMPQVARRRIEVQQAKRRLLLGLVLCGAFIAALAVVADQLMGLVFGRDFEKAGDLLRLSLVGILVASLVLSVAALEVGGGRIWTVAVSSILGGVVTLVCVGIFASFWGALGAVVGTVVGHLTNLVGLLTGPRPAARSSRLEGGSGADAFRMSG